MPLCRFRFGSLRRSVPLLRSPMDLRSEFFRKLKKGARLLSVQERVPPLSISATKPSRELIFSSFIYFLRDSRRLAMRSTRLESQIPCDTPSAENSAPPGHLFFQIFTHSKRSAFWLWDIYVPIDRPGTDLLLTTLVFSRCCATNCDPGERR